MRGNIELYTTLAFARDETLVLPVTIELSLGRIIDIDRPKVKDKGFGVPMTTMRDNATIIIDLITIKNITVLIFFRDKPIIKISRNPRCDVTMKVVRDILNHPYTVFNDYFSKEPDS
jgi:hypothetical protein